MAKVVTKETHNALRIANGGGEVEPGMQAHLRRLEFAVNGDNGLPFTLTESGKAALEMAKVIDEEKDVAKSKPKAKSTKETLGAKELAMGKKYKHFVAGSLRSVPGANKLRCEIKCQTCGKERTVWSSDVFQVKVCMDCKKGGKKKAPKAKAVKKPKAKKEKTSDYVEEAAPSEAQPVQAKPDLDVETIEEEEESEVVEE